MASADGGPAMLDEAREVRLVAAVAEEGLGEGDVGNLEFLGPNGKIKSSLPEEASEFKVAF